VRHAEAGTLGPFRAIPQHGYRMLVTVGPFSGVRLPPGP
jgi:hypothetical protein